MKKVRTKRTVRIWSIIVFLVVFLSTNGGVHVIILNHENEEKMKAEYTAEITIGRFLGFFCYADQPKDIDGGTGSGTIGGSFLPLSDLERRSCQW